MAKYRQDDIMRKKMFNSLFSLFSHDIGIDLGTANTLIYVKGKGIVIREPSMVAIHKKSKKIIAVGTQAKKMIGKTPADIVAIKPLRHGVISDFDLTQGLLSYYITQVHLVDSMLPKLARPRIVIGIPSGVTEVERRAVWEACLRASAREAYLIEEPMAAAIGASISIEEPTGAAIVDIGGGTTEVAVISLGGIVVGKTIKIAGDEMDEAIISYIRLRHGLLIGERTAEEVKIQIGSAYQTSKNGKSGDKIAVVRGRDIETGLPRSLKVGESEIREALAGPISQIIDAIAETLEETPPELVSDISQNGIVLTGGGSLLRGIDQLIVERTRMPVFVVDDPLTTVVRGTGKLLEDTTLLQKIKVTGGLR